MSVENVDRDQQLLCSLDNSGVFLVQEMSGGLTRYARARGLDDSAVEEIVQDALFTILAKRPAVDSPEAWLIRIVDRRCTDWHRRQATSRRVLEVFSARAAAVAAEPSTDAIDLKAAVARLPLKAQRVLLARYFEGCRSDEAAERLGYSPASFRNALRRALQALRASLAAPVSVAPSPRDSGFSI